MRPLEELPEVDRALLSAPQAEVRRAIDAASGDKDISPSKKAALAFAEGALLLRSGTLDAAATKLDEAASLFESHGDAEQVALARIEAHTARVRRGVRELAIRARDELAALEKESSSERVKTSALLLRGTAERVLGEAAHAHEAFLGTIERSARFPDLRSQALNSLGTLYVVTGALSAAVPNLERAAELCHMRGDVVGEAIAVGQLGAAALGLGDLAAARRHLSRQEFLANRVGDAFGASRALVWLAEVALSLGAPNDAVDIATRAKSVAEPAGLTTWQAYANRVAGRAMVERGDSGRELTEAALATFQNQKLPLGEALCQWDLAVGESSVDVARIERALSIFASLGLVDRVAEVLSDLRRAAASPRGGAPSIDVLLATVGLSGRRAESLEAQLVHDDPIGLAAATELRTSAKRNVARLALLSISTPGLVVLAVSGVADPLGFLADRGFVGTLLGQMADVSLFGWHIGTEPEAVSNDVDRLVSRFPAARGAFEVLPDAAVESPGHGGGTGAALRGVATAELLGRALAAHGIAKPDPWRKA